MFKNDSVGDSRNGFSFIKAYFGEHCPGRHEQDTFPLAGNDARQDKRSQHGGGAAAGVSRLSFYFPFSKIGRISLVMRPDPDLTQTGENAVDLSRFI